MRSIVRAPETIRRTRIWRSAPCKRYYSSRAQSQLTAPTEDNDKVNTLTEGGSKPLFDSFMRKHDYLRISLTERCNLRCQYCMPAEGVQLTPPAEVLTFEELIRLTKVFSNLGVRKLRLTGGEPTIYPRIADLISEVKANTEIEHVAITSNAYCSPMKLHSLRMAGLDSINISLDTLQEERFRNITRRAGLARVLGNIDECVSMGMDTKVNCVLMRDVNDDEVEDFVERFMRTYPIVLRFIEFMPFDGNRWSFDRFLDYTTVVDRLKQKYGRVERSVDGPNDTTKHYKINDYVGTLGFITSMSNNFCGTCNRLRITSDGNIKVCLFDNGEVSLRNLMREGASNDDIEELVREALLRKKARHGGMFRLKETRNRPMVTIGG
eukprot:Clim_evm86s207 gene=Clim_evmTU86s207